MMMCRYYEWLPGGLVPADGEGYSPSQAAMSQAQAAAVAAAARKFFVHLVQVVPSAMAPRALIFKWPLSIGQGWQKISPGFFDAPGGWQCSQAAS